MSFSWHDYFILVHPLNKLAWPYTGSPFLILGMTTKWFTPFHLVKLYKNILTRFLFIPLSKWPKTCATKREKRQPFVEDLFHHPRIAINRHLHLRDAGFANPPQNSESQGTTFPRLWGSHLLQGEFDPAPQCGSSISTSSPAAPWDALQGWWSPSLFLGWRTKYDGKSMLPGL